MRLLLVEDSAADARLIREMLKDSAAGIGAIQQAARLGAALQRLRDDIFDVVLLDLALPDSHGLATLTRVQAANSGAPIVVLTGVDDESFALEVVRAGAQDYLVKGRFTRELLWRTIRYAVQRKRAEEEIRRLNAQLEQRVIERTAQLQAANDKLSREIVERKRVEEALRLSERAAATHLAQLRTTLDNLAEAVYVCDASGTPLLANPAFQRLTGMTAETMPQHREGIVARFPLYELSGEPVEATDRPTSVALRGEIVSGRELRLAGGSEGDKILRYNAAPVRDAQGSIVMAVLSIEDITARKRSEEALRRSEERLRVAALAAEVGVWFWTPGTNDVEVSANWRRLFGIAPEAPVTFDTWRDALHPDDRERAVRELNAASDEHREFNLEYRVLHPDGSMRWLVDRGQASYDEHGHSAAMAGVNVDITERKLAEEELKTIFDSVPATIWYKDARNTFVRVNRAVTGLIGKSAAEIEGRSAWEIFPQQADKYYADDLEVIRSGHPKLGIVEPVTVANGEVRWMQTDKVPITGPAGEVQGLVAFAIDVTERRLAEEALRRSEQRFRTLADAMPQLAWIAKADGWIYWYNRRWYEYTGTTPEQMEGWGWQSVHDPHALPAVLERWKASLATGQPFDMVFPLRSALGMFHPFLTRVLPLKDEQGRVLQWFGTNTDVSEQKAAEEALRAERDFSTAILDIAPALIVVIDREGRIVRINGACEPITGYSPAELCGRPVWDLVPQEDTPEVHQVWDALCAGNFPNQHENHWVAKDGSSRLISWSNTALVGADGGVEYVIATGVDVTDHRKAEQALIRSEKLVLVGRMAATIAHEINNPLAAAINSLYLAKTEESLSDTARYNLDVADKQLARVAHITKQTLGFYREIRDIRGVKLTDVLDGVLDLYAPKLQNKSVRVQREYATTASVQAVEGELRQVISNLVANSIDAVNTSGTLWARTSVARSRNGRPMVRVTIADSGCGIPQENLKRIFEPFFTTKQAVGTGLGLWVTKELVEKQDGRIRVRSKPGKGTVFAIWLPTERRNEARMTVA